MNSQILCDGLCVVLECTYPRVDWCIARSSILAAADGGVENFVAPALSSLCEEADVVEQTILLVIDTSKELSGGVGLVDGEWGAHKGALVMQP